MYYAAEKSIKDVKILIKSTILQYCTSLPQIIKSLLLVPFGAPTIGLHLQVTRMFLHRAKIGEAWLPGQLRTRVPVAFGSLEKAT